MTGLLSLPTELLQDIGVKFESSAKIAKKDLRLVCKQINFALEPQVLSAIKLLPGLHLSSKLESLANTESKLTSVSKYATRLKIYGLCPEYRDVPQVEEAKIRSFLFSAVASLTGVRTVVWELCDPDQEWAVLLLLDALASLPLLQDLHLRCWFVPKPSWQLRQLPHVVNFTFTCAWGLDNYRSIIVLIARFIGWSQPKLKTLIIADQQYYANKNTPYFNDFLSEIPDSAFLNITHLSLSGLFVGLDATVIPHLRSLISLHIKNIFSPRDQASETPGSSSGDVWPSLRLENIHLQEIVTDDVQLVLIEYLASFSGLRRLRLTKASNDSMSRLASDQLAIEFYGRALQNHVHSLESLEIDASYEGNWCFASLCSNIIKQCACLTSLKLSINSKDVEEEKNGDDDDEEDFFTGKGNRNAIFLLLEICANLPF